jgi:DNA-binding MarR family transcriptional regulator
MVDGLVAGGLVQRSHWPIDGRSVSVSVTAKGTALLERLASEHAKEFLKQVAFAHRVAQAAETDRPDAVIFAPQSKQNKRPSKTPGAITMPYRQRPSPRDLRY